MIKQYYPSLGLAKLCGLFGKTRQAFYDHSNRDTDQPMREALIVDKVTLIRHLQPRIGCIKLHRMLKEDLAGHHIFIGRDRFCKLMRRLNLQVKRKRRYACTTDSNHRYHKWSDLTPGLQLTAPGQLLVSDITYLRTTKGFVYLSLITDAYSRKIIGHHLSLHLKAEGCLIALNKALGSLQNKGSAVIHHSDRGIQYCCDAYIQKLQQNHIKISMTQNGNPYENALAERVNGILKSELGLDSVFDSYGHAVGSTHQAIDVYNRLRPHMSCSYLTPSEAHINEQPLKKQWKSRHKIN
jgi:putative transposase